MRIETFVLWLMGPKTQSVLIERFALDFSAIILLTQW